jgi:hypothetical protein
MKACLSAIGVIGGLLIVGVAQAASIPACKGVSNSTINSATASAQSQVCSHIVAIAAGTELESKKQLSADAKAIFLSLETEFNLPPFCAGAIVAIQAQGLANGKVSAGSCPAK